MSLGYEVLRFADRAFKDPSFASDPNVLRRLAKYAKESFEGIVALHAPVSPMTWEVSTFIDGATQQTARQAFNFPRPVEIVGFYSTIVVDAADSSSTITPSTAVIACQIDTDVQNYLTSADGISSPAGGKASTFVTLAALDVQVPRLVGYKLRNPKPNIGFTYRWKQDVTGGAIYKDAMISTAIYARYI